MKYIINYRKVTILVLNLLLSIFISNCSPIPSMVPSITPSGSENILPATTSELPIFNPTDLAPIITSTATQIIIPLVERRCMQSAEEPLPALEGRLVLAGYRLEGFSSWTDGQSYLYDLQDSSSTLLGTTRYETVSPNGDLLAYYEKSSDLVVVSGKEGSRILELSADNASLFPAYWIDNQRLVLNKLLNHSFRSDFASLLIINPFTNEKEEWLPEFYQQDHGSYYDWKVTSNLIFNPSFNRLIYPVLANNQFDLVLLDLNADREIARIYEGAFRECFLSQFVANFSIRRMLAI